MVLCNWGVCRCLRKFDAGNKKKWSVFVRLNPFGTWFSVIKECIKIATRKIIKIEANNQVHIRRRKCVCEKSKSGVKTTNCQISKKEERGERKIKQRVRRVDIEQCIFWQLTQDERNRVSTFDQSSAKRPSSIFHNAAAILLEVCLRLEVSSEVWLGSDFVRFFRVRIRLKPYRNGPRATSVPVNARYPRVIGW